MRLGVSSAVVDGHLVEGDIEVTDGLIAAVGLSGGSGNLIAVPGFIDVHTHGYGGVDFARAGEPEMGAASAALPKTGVTAFQPTLITMDPGEMAQAIRVHSGARYPGSRFLGTHLEGPFLSPQYPGAHQPELLLSPRIDLAQDLVGPGGVGQVTMAPELPGAIEVIRHLVAAGSVVSLGHSNASAEEANSGFDAGASAVTHIFNASRPFGHRDPGIIGVGMERDDVFITAIVDGVHLSKEAALIAARVAGSRLVAITDAMSAAGLGDGNYVLGNRGVTVAEGQVRLDGTIASSVLTMDEAFRNLVALGLSLVETSEATSSAPARMLGRDELGSIGVGSVADVAILDSNLGVIRTYVAGIEVFSA